MLRAIWVITRAVVPRRGIYEDGQSPCDGTNVDSGRCSRGNPRVSPRQNPIDDNCNAPSPNR